MQNGSDRRLLVVWLALSAVTLAQLGLGAGAERSALAPSATIAVGAIGIALLKVRFILREFMEVRHAPALLGRVTDLWLALTGVVLLATYFSVLGLRS